METVSAVVGGQGLMRLVLMLAMLMVVSSVPRSLRNDVSRRLQTPLTPDSTCVPGDVDLTFARAVVTHNNLGGVGPDSGDENIVFANVGNYRGNSINMVVSVKPGAEYVVAELERNGMICYTARKSCELGGDFGQVNLKSNHETTLVFQFQSNSTGEPLVLPGFLFSGLDIDGELLEETYVIKGWETAFYDRNSTETYFSENEPEFCQSGESCLYTHSTNFGNVCDNPTDAFNLTTITCAGLTVDQRARSFMLAFTDTSEFEVYFRTMRPEIQYGRNFVFAFASSWSDGCMLPPTTAIPTGAPTAMPTGTPTAMATGTPTAMPTSVSPTARPVASPTARPVASPTNTPTNTPVAAATNAPIKAATGKPTMPPVTNSPSIVTKDVLPTCPPVVPDYARTESDSSKGKGGKGKGGKGKGQRVLRVGSRDECPEPDSEESHGKAGSGKAGKAGSEKDGSGKSGKAGSEKVASGKSASGKSGKAGSEKDGSGKSGEAGSDKASSDKASSEKTGSDKASSDKASSDKTSKGNSGKAGSDKSYKSDKAGGDSRRG